MKKKIIVGIIIGVLIVAVIALSVALILTLNKGKDSKSKNKSGKNNYETIISEFAESLKDEDKLQNFIDEYIDFKACYTYGKLSDATDADEDDYKVLFEEYYNNPDEEELEEAQSSYSRGILDLLNYDLNLTVKEVAAPVPFSYDLPFDDVPAIYENEDGTELVFNFIFYKGKIVVIIFPSMEEIDSNGASDQPHYYVEFTEENGVSYLADYSAFGMEDSDLSSIYADDIQKNEGKNNGCILDLAGGVKCRVYTNETGYVNKLDFSANWTSSSTGLESTWIDYVIQFVNALELDDYSELKTKMAELANGFDDNFSYDDELPFPQEVYNESRVVDHIKLQIITTGISESEVEFHYIISCVGEE